MDDLILYLEEPSRTHIGSDEDNCADVKKYSCVSQYAQI